VDAGWMNARHLHLGAIADDRDAFGGGVERPDDEAALGSVRSEERERIGMAGAGERVEV
jgi:hypothetical protein